MLSISILRRSAHSGGEFLSGSSVLLAFNLLAICASGEGAISARTLSKANQIIITKRLSNLLEKDPFIAEPSPMLQGIERSSLSLGENPRWLSPVTVSYKSISNKYCRLATSDFKLTNTSIIPLPPSALHDNCLKLKAQYIVDATGNGLRDVAQLVLVKSNRAAFAVNEVLIYLADASSDGGYCYSQQVSLQLPPTSMNSAAAANKALREARKRLPHERFSCR